MANNRPIRYPSGISTYAPRHVLNTFPVLPSPSQVTTQEDFIPYRASDYTITTAVAGTITAFQQVGGSVKMATSASATDTIFLARGGTGFQFLVNNSTWCDTRLAYPRSVLNANDTNIYWGLFDNASPLAAANGVYFVKPAGGTSVNFVIKKAGVTTTFQNVGDLALPSGLFGDTNSVNATLSATIAGGAFSAISAATPGAGYEWQPLILSTAASGVAGNNIATAVLGNTTFSPGNPVVPLQSGGLPYASIQATYLNNPGSGYTNQGPLTTLLEVEPLLNFAFTYDGKGNLYVGVNGRTVMAIVGTASSIGVTGIAPGGTATVTAANNSFYCSSQLPIAVAPFQPPLGSPMNMLPLVPLGYSIGFANTTANVRTLFVDEFSLGTEIA